MTPDEFFNQNYPVTKKIYSNINDVKYLMDQYLKINLQEYTEYLLENGYCDIDVFCEGNTSIDRFLNPKLR
jgi:hypothetical protein